MNCRRCALYPLVLVLVLGTPLLSACGRKGPLYLPERPAPQKSASDLSSLR